MFSTQHRKGAARAAGGIVFVFALLLQLPVAAAGYYSADGTSAAAPPTSGGADSLHTIVVMSADKCFAALGQDETDEIVSHYKHPYMECVRRLKLKKAAEKETKAADKKAAAEKQEKDSLTQKEIEMQKTSGGTAEHIITKTGGYYSVPQQTQQRTPAPQQPPAAAPFVPQDPEQAYLATHPSFALIPPPNDHAKDFVRLNQ